MSEAGLWACGSGRNPEVVRDVFGVVSGPGFGKLVLLFVSAAPSLRRIVVTARFFACTEGLRNRARNGFDALSAILRGT